MSKKKSLLNRITKATVAEKLVASSDDGVFVRDISVINRCLGALHPQSIGATSELKQIFWRRIDALMNIERDCFSRRDRFWFYHYLSAVYKFYREMSEYERSTLGLYFLKRYLRPQCMADYDIFYILLDITSQADQKTKSRWRQALRYAYTKRKGWRRKMTLREFFRNNGGVAGCARKSAIPRKKSRTKSAPRYWP